MSDDKIVSLMEAKLKEGVSEKQLAEYLSNAGYSLYDIDHILTKAKARASGESSSIPSFLKKIAEKNRKKLLFSLLGFSIAVGIVLVSVAYLSSFSNEPSTIVVSSNADFSIGSFSYKKIVFEAGGTVVFDADGSSHSFSIQKIVDDAVYVVFSSQPMVFVMKQGEKRKVDLDFDSFADVEVAFVSMNKGYPVFELRRLGEKIGADVPDYFLNESQAEHKNPSGKTEVKVPSGPCSNEKEEVSIKCVDDSKLEYAICFNGQWVVNIKTCPAPTYSIKGGEVKSICEDNECRFVNECNEGLVFVNSSNNLKYCCNKTSDNESICNDGLDNDCDGLVDLMDSDCASPCVGNETVGCWVNSTNMGVRRCVNGTLSKCEFSKEYVPFDRCDDGLIRMSYFGFVDYCCNKTGDKELNCTDKLDNDCDGLFDINDPDCSWYCEGDEARACLLNDGSVGEMKCSDNHWSDCLDSNTSGISLINVPENEEFELSKKVNAKLVDCDNMILTFDNASEETTPFNDSYFDFYFTLTNNSGFTYTFGLSKYYSFSSLNLTAFGYFKPLFLGMDFIEGDESPDYVKVNYSCSETPCSPGEEENCIDIFNGYMGMHKCGDDGFWRKCVPYYEENCTSPYDCCVGQTQNCTTEKDCPGTQTCGADGLWGECVDVPDDDCPVSINPPPSSGGVI